MFLSPTVLLGGHSIILITNKTTYISTYRRNKRRGFSNRSLLSILEILNRVVFLNHID